MKEEMNSLKKNHTWELVDQPPGQQLVSYKWLYKIKEGIEGVQKPRYKARMVARGFTQRVGIDYNEVFSPVVRHTSIRVILSLTACKDYKLEQLDVKMAFLHGNLEETIYMRQPPGFEEGTGNKVCLLKKSLYGLKQSPRQWYKRFDVYMISNGFSRIIYDSCVYFKEFAPGMYIYLLLYVDDMLIACKSKYEIKYTKGLLRKEFDLKELGPARKILGMEIVRDKGSLMYLMVCTRLDIAYVVSIVSRYLANPGKTHWEAVKWILKYLKGTADVGLVYGRDQGKHADVDSFMDADYAKDPDKVQFISQELQCFMRGRSVRHHFIREIVKSKEIEVPKIGTKDNAADAFTKVVPDPPLVPVMIYVNMATKRSLSTNGKAMWNEVIKNDVILSSQKAQGTKWYLSTNGKAIQNEPKMLQRFTSLVEPRSVAVNYDATAGSNTGIKKID
ncbi:retrovirus-related pol polyprotein from transposon TNT 1-94 [Tanacetum coccineum]